jgi:hypothetical protein
MAETPPRLPSLPPRGGQPGHTHCWHGDAWQDLARPAPPVWCCWCGAACPWNLSATDHPHGPYVGGPRPEGALQEGR